MTDDADTTVYRIPLSAPTHSERYHADRHCHALDASPRRAVETTERKARLQGRVPCADCVGKTCPRCGTTVARLRYHLKRCEADP
jgi:hypothetical protein